MVTVADCDHIQAGPELPLSAKVQLVIFMVPALVE